VVGSPSYIAPEVLAGTYSEKVDVWGAGVLLHALLIGILPFRGESVKAIFEAIKLVQLDFHSENWQSISVLAKDLLSRMLSRDVEKRLSPQEVLSE
jgi:serine/threonine protein kinase